MKKLLLLAAVALASCWFVAGCAHPVDAPVSVPHKTELMLDSLDVCAEAAPAPVVECAFHVGRQRQVMCMPSGAIMPSVPAPVLLPPGYNTEEYKSVQANRFKLVSESPLSTFGADVDTASYTMVRSHLQRRAGPTPPPDAIRIEEFVNYFSYDYPAPAKGRKFGVAFESIDAPWNTAHKLLLVGVQAEEAERDEIPAGHYVFLVDNSGSMGHVMPLVRAAMGTLADQMRPDDKVSLVTYGGGVNVLMEGISGKEKETIRERIERLGCGGYTPGGAGIQTAYELAHKHFIKGGNNRVILITDGDFNVGVSSEGDLVAMVEKERDSAIYLTALGVGYGNYRDNKLKMLANKGNGNYSFLDSEAEARRVMQSEFAGKMLTVAKDVKFQIEFNPAKVHSYRLLGYELRHLEAEDFKDDTKDAGEVGAGHQVTVLYELVMADSDEAKAGEEPSVDPLKYQTKSASGSDEILTFKLRYQQPEGGAPSVEETSVLAKLPRKAKNIRWASAVAEFALCLRHDADAPNASLDNLWKRAQKAIGTDKDGKRSEFLSLVKAAQEMPQRPARPPRDFY